ncbi:PAP/fibrillin family protein [Nodosilinea sp. P-1105]|uniref:PAP/fibrillin family protein n=1 Tax=Nodosilinea sp. P-1105 TaxID=2546229 RepID=UPI00197F1E2E|nr:PAP/fibrillin family protein [Nodosilinea sp. P-1105]
MVGSFIVPLQTGFDLACVCDIAIDAMSLSSLQRQRTQLKHQLLQQIQALPSLEALLPSQHPTIDQLIADLEYLNPIDQPLDTHHHSVLLGTWDLIYASRGTVVTRNLGSGFPWSLPIQRVWQRLARNDQADAPIATENGATFLLPFFGELTATAKGTWQPYAEAESAKVSFGTIGVQATRLLGIAGLHLPKLTVPVLEGLRREALWITSYLDDDLRFGRGVTGNLFVFQRSPLQIS